MADVSISKFTQLIRLQGQASVPSLPPSTEDTPPAVNPPGSGGLTGVNQFIQLTDTPASYSGATLNYARVNAGETGLEFRTPAQVLTDIGGIGGTIASGQVAFGTGSGEIGGDSGLVWDNVNKRFQINRNLQDPNLEFEVFKTSPVVGARNLVGQFVTGITNVNTELSIRLGVSSITNSTFGSVDLISKRTNNPLNGYSDFIISLSNGSSMVDRFIFKPLGEFGVNTTSPTETLDVNGTARIRTINNLGSTPTEVLVPSATGVVSKRTLTEFKSDLAIVPSDLGQEGATDGQVLAWVAANSRYEPVAFSGSSQWVTVGSNIRYDDGYIYVGNPTSPTVSGSQFRTNTATDLAVGFRITNLDETVNVLETTGLSVRANRLFVNDPTISVGNPPSLITGAFHMKSTNNTFTLMRIQNNSDVVAFDLSTSLVKFNAFYFQVGAPVSPGNYIQFRCPNNTFNAPNFEIQRNDGTVDFRISGGGRIFFPTIPTSDPLLANQIYKYNDGTRTYLCISDG